jgi:hypothetical protein
VLDAEACNTDSFLSRDISVFSTQLNRATWNKDSHLYVEAFSSPKYSLQKVHQFSLKNNVLDAATSKIDGFLGDTNMFLQQSRICLFGIM